MSNRATKPPSHRPAILFVGLAPGIGGSMRSLATLLDGLGDVERVVAAPYPSSFSAFVDQRKLVDTMVPISGASGPRMKRLSDALRLTIWILHNRKRIVAIHANGISELNLVASASRAIRGPVVVWVHDWTLSSWAKRLGHLWDFCLPRLAWATVSESSRQMLLRDKVTTRPIAVIPNPIDSSDVVAKDRKSDGVFTLGYVGTPARYKGFHLLPEIIEALVDLPLRWRIFAGPQSMEPETWARLRAIPGDTIEIPGKVADVRTAYGSCDAIVCPSLGESFGRVAVEAMANGLPVIASDIPALREVVGATGAAILTPPGDTAAIADAIRSVHDDRTLRDALGRAGPPAAMTFEPFHVWSAFRAIYNLDSGTRRPALTCG
jgi:glycosyltransferase involved in cell wall biosynthesis